MHRDEQGASARRHSLSRDWLAGAAPGRLLLALTLCASTVAAAQTFEPDAEDIVDAGRSEAIKAEAASPEVTPEAAPAASDEVDYFADFEQKVLDELINAPVVTASGGASESRALSAANVVVITREEISRRGWISLAEVLANVRGLYVIDDFVLPSVAVRGVAPGPRGGSRVIRVMINGVPVSFAPDLTALLGPEFIPIETIERVEIAKGPLSALYGANAFLATVNVITRRPAKAVEAQVGGRLHLVSNNLTAGGWGLLSFGFDNFDLMLSVSADSINRAGLRIQKTYEAQDPEQTRFRAFFSDKSRDDYQMPVSVFGIATFTPPHVGTFQLQGGLQRLDSMGEFQIASVLTHKTRIAIENAWASLRFERKWGTTVTTWATVGFARGRPTREEVLFQTSNNTASYTRNFGYWSVDASLGADILLGTQVVLTAGIDFSRQAHDVLSFNKTFYQAQGTVMVGETVKQVTDRDLQRLIIFERGAYLQVAATPFVKIPDLKLSANFRLDYPSLIPLQYSWRAAAAYAITPRFTTKLIVGRAYQSPSAVLYYGLPGFGIDNNVFGSRTLPSSDYRPLLPQVVHSAELVVSTRIGDHVALEGSVYGQLLDNKIEFVPVVLNYVAQNLGVQRHLGVEGSLNVFIKRFSPYLNFNLQGSFDDTLDGSLKFSTVAYAYPTISVAAGLNVELPEIFMNANAQVSVFGPRGASSSNIVFNNYKTYELPPYARLDLALNTINLKWLGPQTDTRLRLRIMNLFDARPSEPGFTGFDVPTIGRTMMLELRQQL